MLNQSVSQEEFEWNSSQEAKKCVQDYFRTEMKAKCTQEARMREEAEKLVRL